MTIPGEAGTLEAMLNTRGKKGAVLCHPHPLYGGSMYDGVLEIVDAALAQSDITTLRFNFRGVGGSEGHYDDGDGEVDDVVSACDWLSANSDTMMATLLCGYSFGAAMVARAAPRVSCEAMVLIAPPVGMLKEPAQIDCPALVILGENDTIVDAQAAREFFPPSAEIHVVSGADHFFHGAADAISGKVAEFCAKIQR